jgi:glycosyltransferase involved in cell wall biosynthesis
MDAAAERPRLVVVANHPIQYFAPLFRALAAADAISIHVVFISRKGLDPYFDPGFGQSFKWDIPLVEGYSSEFLSLPQEGPTPSTLKGWRRLGERLDRLDPDAVLVFGYSRWECWRAARWARKHERDVLYLSDSSIGSPSSAVRRAVKHVVVRYFYRHVDIAFSTTENNRRYHQHLGMPVEKMRPSRLPIDVDAIRRSADGDEDVRRTRIKLGIPPDAFVLVISGKLVPHKRPADVLDAVAGLPSQGPPVWVMYLGEGSSRSDLEERAWELGIADRVVFTGFVNQREIGRFYASSDVLVMPSDREPHGLSATEGAALGLPLLVSTAVGCLGRNDVARPDENCLSFPPGDSDVLARHIQTLRSDGALRRRMGEASRVIADDQDVSVAAACMVDAVTELDVAKKASGR